MSSLGPKVLDHAGRSTYPAEHGRRHHFLMAMATNPATLATTIEHIERAVRERQLLRRARARAAVKAADGLLDQLEMLVLTGRHNVPASMLGSLDALGQAASGAGVDRVSLEPNCGVLRLMDDVYELEARLLRRCH